MKSDKVERWLTLISHIAVLVGIVAVVAELRQNSAVMRAQIGQARADNIATQYRENIHSDHWPSLWAARVQVGGDAAAWAAGLNAEDFERARSYVLMEINDLRNQFEQYRDGYLEQTVWETLTRGQIRRVLPLVPVFMPGLEGQGPDFEAAVNAIADEEGLPHLPNSP